MSVETFLRRRGFGSGDPLAHTNSEQEERLEEYFIPPPYFQSVMGDPSTPKTSVVFAPRGSGKTAQRIMIERQSQSTEADFLCLTYDSFGFVETQSASLAAHQVELCRLLTVAVLSILEDDDVEAVFLTDHERQVVKVAAYEFVGTLGLGEYEAAVSAVKTLGDKAADFWRKYGGPVAAGLAILMQKAGLDDVEVNVTLADQARDASHASASYFLAQLVAIAVKLGRYEAVYFLVDKADETSGTTNNAEAAGKLVQNLITDLPTLEAPRVAFKFFLWDQMAGYLQANGLRPDRLEVVKLGWTPRELSQMLERRFLAFSEGSVKSFNELTDPSFDFDSHELLVHLSHGSPRDMIRMARAIVGEHTRMPDEVEYITERTFWRGVLSFSRDSTVEKYGRFQSDFSRVARASFTIPEVASVFKFTSAGAGNKVQAWVAGGAARALGTRPNPGARPLNLYGMSDIRLLIATAGTSDLRAVIDESVFKCASCSELIITSDPETECPNCSSTVDFETSLSLMDLVELPV